MINVTELQAPHLNKYFYLISIQVRKHENNIILGHNKPINNYYCYLLFQSMANAKSLGKKMTATNTMWTSILLLL